jgi:hypothetical protein
MSRPTRLYFVELAKECQIAIVANVPMPFLTNDEFSFVFSPRWLKFTVQSYRTGAGMPTSIVLGVPVPDYTGPGTPTSRLGRILEPVRMERTALPKS